jgi:hypothetical protein
MATTVYFRFWNGVTGGSDKPPVRCRIGTGALYTGIAGSAVAWDNNALETTRGGTNSGGYPLKATVTGPTTGVELDSSGISLFVSPPLAAGVTISGAITANVWASEASMTDNAAINVRVMKLTNGSSGSHTISEVVRSARVTELATSAAVNNFSFTPASGVSFNRGDRIIVSLFGDDAGTMAAGGYIRTYLSGPTAAASGDSYLTFTETLTFEGTPTGTSVYLTNDAVSINPGSATELLAWGNRGSGVSTAVTATQTTPTSPIQMTSTSGGTALEWYTPPLDGAQTLQGAILVNIRALMSSADADAATRCEIAVVDGDGTNASVWAWGGGGTDDTSAGGSYILLTTSEATAQYLVTGADKSMTDGQRIRIRLYIDNAWGQDYSLTGAGMASGYTTTLYYGGSSGGSGDSYLTFSQTISFKPLTQTKSLTLDAIITNAWGWKSPPADTAAMGTTPLLLFTTPNPGGSTPQGFEIQLDTSSSFDTANLRAYRQGDGLGAWEYHNGSGWVAMPPEGMPSAYKGNDARFTPPALTETTWYRRLRYTVNGT